MTEACQRVHALVDGELSPEEAHRVRLHLATCTVCQEELGRLLQLKALSQEPEAPADSSSAPSRPQRQRAFRPRWSRYARPGGLAVLVTAVACAALFLVLPGLRGPRGELLWMTSEPTRPLELRLSYPGADQWRPYETMRGAGPQDPVPLKEMAKLEEAGDLRGLAAAYLLRKDAEGATAYLRNAGASPDVETDLAVVSLLRGDPPGALARLDEVLARTPSHAQAMWNRALTLAQLSLELSAAEQLEAVAALNEPGWAQEAQRRAQELLSRATREREGWHAAIAAGVQLMTHSAVPSAEEAQAHPGPFRLYLYDALRTARTVEQVRALFPVAEALDTLAGGTTLRDAVRRTEARDLGKRAPLAEDYERLARRAPLPGGAPAFLERLRSAGEEDLLLGALLYAGAVGDHLEEYQRLATATRDPWFLLLAEHEHAKALIARGELLPAEQRLLEGVKRCGEHPVAYRCAQLELELASLYRQLQRVGEAAQHAQAARQWSRKDSAWWLDLKALGELGQLARLERQPAMARAWFHEIQLREPQDSQLLQPPP